MIKTAQEAYLAGRQAAMQKLAMSTEAKRDYFRKGLEDKMKEQNYSGTKALVSMGALGGLAFGKGRGRLLNSLKGAGLGLGGGLSLDLSKPERYQKKIDRLNAMSEEEVDKNYRLIKDLEAMLKRYKDNKND